MAINIKFDLSGNPEPPTIILANRSGNKLGQLKVNEDSIGLIDKFNDASELSFTVNKYINDKITPLWDKLVDFKLVYCKEWDLWFETRVELDEETESVKTVFCTQLGQAELSQTMLYGVEINTEKDIERDDYKISILYDEKDPKASILDRLLDKAPHYSIAHVDSTISKIQRTFSFDGTSICDAFQEVAEEIGCLFIYHSNSDEYGKIQRTISVYDLQQNCNGCGHRGEFTDKCPKCDGTNIKQGYGKDTLIFVTSDELASEGIQLTTDTDSVKNCFKLEAGDDLMTATIRNCNPNGSDYIWRFSDMTKEDMSNELVEKIESYDSQYQTYYNDYESKLNTTLVNKYNALVTKYSPYNEDLQPINTSIKGYSNLMNAYYNTIDMALYLKSGLMPNVEMSGTTAKDEAALLTAAALSPVAVNTEKISSVSLATANSAVLSMAKIIVRSTYKVEVNTSSISTDKTTWTGSFIVTNYSDEEDTATSGTINVTINNDTETFIKQKIEKALNKEDADDYSISGLFAKDYDEFCAELKKYALNPLRSFYDSCDSCLDILIEQDAGDKKKKPDLYKDLYQPYYKKSSAIAKELKLRESEIAVIEGVWDNTDENNPKLKTKGLQYYIEKCRSAIQNALNFEKYLGNKLWTEFCSYRREDTYSNSNYISDGLNNAELFEKALEFIKVANNEIYKASELQHSISTNLNNLLSIDRFKPLVDYFNLGNWIRVQVNDEIYKLRLIEYELDFGSIENIPVEFSDITKIKNGITDIESVLSQASSMATSYDSVQRQAKQGDNAKISVDNWLENGLNSAIVRIKSNNNEEVTMTQNGLLCRSYDDIGDSYSPEQFRLTHNIMAYTTDNWETVSAALGKHDYLYYVGNYDDGNQERKQGTDYGLTAKFVTAGYINGSQIIGGEIYSQNYTSTTGTYMDLDKGKFSWAGGKIKYDGSNVTLDGVTIQWNNTNSPSVSNVSGLQDALDGKSTTYTNKPSSQRKGDLLVPSSTFTATYNSQTYTFTAKKIYRCTTTNTSFNPSQWAEVNYTDDTKANSAYSLANAAKELGNALVNGLGFQETEITGSYVISPVIAGGQLLIGDKSGVYAQITTGGKLSCSSADINGKITATSGSITGNLTVSGSLTHTNGDYRVTLRGVQDNKSLGVFYITDNSSGSSVYPFVVRGDGSFVASKANITGTIHAEDGTIANWDINPNTIRKVVTVDGKEIVTGMQQPSSGTYAFFAGTYDGSTYSNCEFKVTHKGKLYASGASISGDSTFSGTLSGVDGTFKGTLSAVSGSFTKLTAGQSSFTKNKVIIDASYENSKGETVNKGSVIIGHSGYTDSNGTLWDDVTIMPNADNIGNIGTPSRSWDMLCTKNGAIHSSDRNYKKEITEMGEKQEQLFNLLSPVTFKFIDSTHDRFHYGYISQDVEEAIIKSGLTTKDFAGFCKDIKLNDDGSPVLDENGNQEYVYSLRYTEFIALNTHMIQKVQAENQKLKERIDLLEDMIKRLS